MSTVTATTKERILDAAEELMLSACEALSDVMFKFVGVVMAYAPIGIGAAIAVTVSKGGLGILKNLGILVGTLYGALIVFVVFVFIPIALMVVAGLKLRWGPIIIGYEASGSGLGSYLAGSRDRHRRLAACGVHRAAHT